MNRAHLSLLIFFIPIFGSFTWSRPSFLGSSQLLQRNQVITNISKKKIVSVLRESTGGCPNKCSFDSIFNTVGLFRISFNHRHGLVAIYLAFHIFWWKVNNFLGLHISITCCSLVGLVILQFTKKNVKCIS